MALRCVSSSKWYLKQPTLLFAALFSSDSCMSSRICLNYGDYALIKGERNRFRFYSGSRDDGSWVLNADDVDELKQERMLFGQYENDVKLKSMDVYQKTPLEELRKVFPGKSRGNLTDPERVSQIVDLVKKDEDNFESRMNMLAQDLGVKELILVFKSLNNLKVSGLRLFRWVQLTNNKLHRTADFCSLIICNCGHLRDYETMDMLLKELRQEKICISELAFEFLPLVGSGESGAKESIKHTVQLFNKAGGSCYSSGIHSLIQMLCSLDLFDVAKYVIQITERKVSHMNALIREKCKRGLPVEALGIIIEMRKKGCHADTKSYNFIIGCLCKMNRMDEAFSVFESMKTQGVPADALSYEILIYFLCKLDKVNDACQFFNQMVSDGLRPRLSVHAPIIDAFIRTQQCEEAYRYVINASVKDIHSSPMIYTTLVKVHRKHGNIMSARNIILEMMDKDLRPNYSEYMQLVRLLKGNLATELKNKYSRFISPSGTSVPHQQSDKIHS